MVYSIHGLRNREFITTENLTNKKTLLSPTMKPLWREGVLELDDALAGRWCFLCSVWWSVLRWQPPLRLALAAAVAAVADTRHHLR